MRTLSFTLACPSWCQLQHDRDSEDRAHQPDLPLVHLTDVERPGQPLAVTMQSYGGNRPWVYIGDQPILLDEVDALIAALQEAQRLDRADQADAA